MADIRHRLRLDRQAEISHCSKCRLSIAGASDAAWSRVFWEDKIERGEVVDPDEIDHVRRLIG